MRNHSTLAQISHPSAEAGTSVTRKWRKSTPTDTQVQHARAARHDFESWAPLLGTMAAVDTEAEYELVKTYLQTIDARWTFTVKEAMARQITPENDVYGITLDSRDLSHAPDGVALTEPLTISSQSLHSCLAWSQSHPSRIMDVIVREHLWRLDHYQPADIQASSPPLMGGSVQVTPTFLTPTASTLCAAAWSSVSIWCL